jgi:hypothetical protein
LICRCFWSGIEDVEDPTEYGGEVLIDTLKDPEDNLV